MAIEQLTTWNEPLTFGHSLTNNDILLHGLYTYNYAFIIPSRFK